MTYDNLSLKWVACAVGLIYILVHLPGALAPGSYRRLLSGIPRNYILGVVLTAAAGIWICVLTATGDLGELSPYRDRMVIAWVVGTLAQIIFMPTFLASRGLGLLLLMAATVALDAAFMPETPWRLVLTMTAYVWVIGGILLVASPYLLRDWIRFVSATDERFRRFCWPGVALGLVFIGLGLFVY